MKDFEHQASVDEVMAEQRGMAAMLQVLRNHAEGKRNEQHGVWEEKTKGQHGLWAGERQERHDL